MIDKTKAIAIVNELARRIDGHSVVTPEGINNVLAPGGLTTTCALLGDGRYTKRTGYPRYLAARLIIDKPPALGPQYEDDAGNVPINLQTLPVYATVFMRPFHEYAKILDRISLGREWFGCNANSLLFALYRSFGVPFYHSDKGGRGSAFSDELCHLRDALNALPDDWTVAAGGPVEERRLWSNTGAIPLASCLPRAEPILPAIASA